MLQQLLSRHEAVVKDKAYAAYSTWDTGPHENDNCKMLEIIGDFIQVAYEQLHWLIGKPGYYAVYVDARRILSHKHLVALDTPATSVASAPLTAPGVPRDRGEALAANIQTEDGLGLLVESRQKEQTDPQQLRARSTSRVNLKLPQQGGQSASAGGSRSRSLIAQADREPGRWHGSWGGNRDRYYVCGQVTEASREKLSWENRPDPVDRSVSAPPSGGSARSTSKRALSRQADKRHETSNQAQKRINDEWLIRYNICLKWAAEAIMRYPAPSGYLGSYESMWTFTPRVTI